MPLELLGTFQMEAALSCEKAMQFEWKLYDYMSYSIDKNSGIADQVPLTGVKQSLEMCIQMKC